MAERRPPALPRTMNRRGRPGSMMVALAATIAIALGACAGSSSQAELIEPGTTATSTPSITPTPMPAPAYRAMGEPIGPWTCDDLVPTLPNEASRSVSDPPHAFHTSVDGLVECSVTIYLGPGLSGTQRSHTVFIADFDGEATSLIGGSLDLVEGSDPPRRQTCLVRCEGGVAVNGFIAEVYSQGFDSNVDDLRTDHNFVIDSLVSLLSNAVRPDPLPPVDPTTAPFTACDAAPEELARAIGAILGGDDGAFSSDPSLGGDTAALVSLLAQRRGTTYCAWSLTENADSWTEGVGVLITPGASELIGVPGLPFEDIISTAFSFDINGTAVRVTGVDRAMAEAIAEAHR